jgi:hypothetical protein
MELMGLSDVFEAPKMQEVPTQVREAEILAERLNIPFEEAAIRVGLQTLPDAEKPPQDPIKVREALILADRLNIPFEEAATRVGLQTLPEPEIETGLPPGISANDITGVRKEFNALPEVKEYNAAAAQYQSLISVMEDIDNPAANVAAVFNFMKSLDPTSVVRTEEQGMVARESGPLREIGAMFNKLRSKGSLTPKDRADIVKAARSALLSRYERVLKVYDRYGRIATEQFRLDDPYLVIGDRPTEPEQPLYATDMPPVSPTPVRPPSPGWGVGR